MEILLKKQQKEKMIMNYRKELDEQMTEKRKENLLKYQNKENAKKESEIISQQINEEKINLEKNKLEKMNLYKAQLDKQIKYKKDKDDDY